MMAITVQQPWAWAIIHGGKTVENRTRLGTWRRAAGERIAIHAGARISDRGMADQRVGHALRDRNHLHLSGPGSASLNSLLGAPIHLSAIIGTVVVDDVHPEHGGCCAPWGETSYIEAGGTKRVDVVHLLLSEPRPLATPVPCGGALGLWSVGPWREVLAAEREPVQ